MGGCAEWSTPKKVDSVYLLFCLYLAIIRNIICVFMEHVSFDLSSAHVPKEEVTFTQGQLDKLVLSTEEKLLLTASGLATYDANGKLVELSPQAGDPNCFSNRGVDFYPIEIVSLARSLRHQLNLSLPESEK